MVTCGAPTGGQRQLTGCRLSVDVDSMVCSYGWLEYVSYDGLDSANQISRKLWVFGCRLGRSHYLLM